MKLVFFIYYKIRKKCTIPHQGSVFFNVATMLSSLSMYDCFISMPQLGQLGIRVLIPIDLARTVALHVHNKKLPLNVFTLRQCCLLKQTLSSILPSLLAAQSTWPATPLQRARQSGRAHVRVSQAHQVQPSYIVHGLERTRHMRAAEEGASPRQW